MPLVVGFDHSVTHDLILPEHQGRIFPVRRRVEAGEIEFVATQELFEEATRVIETSDPERLRPFGEVIGALTQGRHLRTPEWIVQTELLGKADPFAGDEERRAAREFLAAAAVGREDRAAARAIAEDGKRKQEEGVADWREMVLHDREVILAASKEARRDFMGTSFEEVDRRHWEKNGKTTALRFAREADAPNPEQIADRVIADPDSFPFTRRFLKVLAVLRYWWLARQRAVGEGDQNDARQLTLLPAMDHFVTNDTAIREWSRIMGDPVGKVVTFEEFFR